jgi:hypothetical protein
MTASGGPSGGGIIFDYDTADPYDFRSGGTHPDTVLRSIRLLHIAAASRHDVTLQQLLSPLVRKLVPDPLWTSRGPCGFERSARSTRSSPPGRPVAAARAGHAGAFGLGSVLDEEGQNSSRSPEQEGDSPCAEEGPSQLSRMMSPTASTPPE